MSQGRSGTSPTKGGSMPQPMYQSPYGAQNYGQPSSPSKGGQSSYGGSVYQQPGQFGGQIFNQQPVGIMPMPSPGGKGGSYQRQPTPYGYGQPTFAPQQFSGYGQPSNIFSFNNPHYQPYNPYVNQPQNTGNNGNPVMPTPEVAAQPVDQKAAMRDRIRSLGQEGMRSGAVTRDMLVQAGYGDPDKILANAGVTQSNPTAQAPMPPPKPPVQASTPYVYYGGMNSGLGSLFNSQQLAQRIQAALSSPSYVPQQGGYNIAGQYDPNMPPGYGTTYQTLM